MPELTSVKLSYRNAESYSELEYNSTQLPVLWDNDVSCLECGKPCWWQGADFIHILKWSIVFCQIWIIYYNKIMLRDMFEQIYNIFEIQLHQHCIHPTFHHSCCSLLYSMKSNAILPLVSSGHYRQSTNELLS